MEDDVAGRQVRKNFEGQAEPSVFAPGCPGSHWSLSQTWALDGLEWGD